MRKAYVGVLVMVCSLSWPLAQASAQTLDQRVAALEAKLKCVTVNGNNLIVTGCNVYIQNGSGGGTQSVNGYGNLIIGYNEGSSQDRTGSHNLVIGQQHTYKSYGGLVAGYQNTISGKYASVTGGSHNVASGDYTWVSGGDSNVANVTYASVSGGNSNIASGYFSSISGGSNNTAEKDFASVSGGENNHAKGWGLASAAARRIMQMERITASVADLPTIPDQLIRRAA